MMQSHGMRAPLEGHGLQAAANFCTQDSPIMPAQASYKNATDSITAYYDPTSAGSLKAHESTFAKREGAQSVPAVGKENVRPGVLAVPPLPVQQIAPPPPPPGTTASFGAYSASALRRPNPYARSSRYNPYTRPTAPTRPMTREEAIALCCPDPWLFPPSGPSSTPPPPRPPLVPPPQLFAAAAADPDMARYLRAICPAHFGGQAGGQQVHVHHHYYPGA